MVTVYIFTSLIVAVWIIRMIKERKIIFKRTALDIPLFIYLASQFISTIISIDPRTSVFGYYSRFNGGLLSTISFSLLYWAFVSNIKRVNLKLIIYSLLVSVSLVAIYGILEHFGGSFSCLIITHKFNDDCWMQDVRTRVFATMGQPNWLAAMLISLIPLTWYYAINPEKIRRIAVEKQRIIWVVVSILFFLCILFTKSRSGLLGLTAAYIIFWVFNFRKNFKLFVIVNALLLLAVLAFGTPFTPSVSNFLQKKQVEVKADTSEGGTESGAIREIVWKGAIGVFKHYPVFGSGVETFGYSYWQYRPIEHNNTSEWDFLYNKAHNEYLNFLANTGVVGFISYIIFISASIYVLRKSPALLAGFVSILITNFFGFSVVMVSLLTFMFPALAVVISNKESKEKESENNLNFNQKVGIGIIVIACGFVLLSIGKYWYADYIYQTGKLEYQLSRYSESVRDSRVASDISPNEALYHDNLSRIYAQLTLSFIEQKDATSASKLATYAVNESDLAFSLSPRNISLRRDRIVILSQLAEFSPSYTDEAIRFTNDTIPLAPTDPKLLVYLGKIYANSNKLDDAITAFQKAIDLKPDYIDPRYFLGIVYKAKKDFKNAKIQFEYILTHLSANNEDVKKQLQDIK